MTNSTILRPQAPLHTGTADTRLRPEHRLPGAFTAGAQRRATARG